MSYTAETNRHEVGQSFYIATNSLMDAFSLKTAGNIQSSAGRQPFTIRIFESASYTNLGTAISTNVGTYLQKLSDTISIPIFPGWLTLDIADVPPTAGKYYTFILSWDSAAPAAGLYQGFSCGNDVSTDSRLWDIFNGVNTPSAKDFAFSVQGTPR